MKTIVLDEPHHFRLTDTPEPHPPGPGEALVRVRRVGICGTDLHAYQGRQAFFSYPRILGHELAVEISALAEGDTQGLKVGKRCAVLPYLHDGSCVACRRGKPNCCVNMQVLGVHVDGGMREFLKVPLELLLPSHNLPLDALAQVEMLAIGAHAVRRAQLARDETVLVIGAGPIGLGTLAFARRQAQRVLALDVSEQRLAFVSDLAIAEVIDGRQDVRATLQDILGGDLPTTVFDATGNANSMMQAVSYVAHSGTLVFVGHTTSELRFDNPELHKRELSLLCSRNATREDFEQVMQALATGEVDIHRWITHRATPEQLVHEFASWLEPERGVVKAVLEFET